jgi:hypothetical protein
MVQLLALAEEMSGILLGGGSGTGAETIIVGQSTAVGRMRRC